jgi:DNA primase
VSLPRGSIPSFYVIPDKRMYHCFGCGAQGDVFRFLMERRGWASWTPFGSWGDASAWRSARWAAGDDEDDPFRAHYEANAFARDFFRRTLADPELGAGPEAYLDERGIDEATQERFGIGYARRLAGAPEAAAKHGISDDLLLEVGLLTTSERAPSPTTGSATASSFPSSPKPGRWWPSGGASSAPPGGPQVPELARDPGLPQGRGALRPGMEPERDPEGGRGPRDRGVHGRGGAGAAGWSTPWPRWARR